MTLTLKWNPGTKCLSIYNLSHAHGQIVLSKIHSWEMADVLRTNGPDKKHPNESEKTRSRRVTKI
jgi:hypothetical protein